MIKLSEKITTGLSIILAAVFSLMAAVTWLAAQSTIIILAPIVLWTLTFFAILAALAGTLAYIAERGEWYATRRVESKRDRSLASNEAAQAKIQTDRAAMKLIFEDRLMDATVRQIETNRIHAGQLGDGAKFSSFPAQIVNQIENSVPLLEAPMEDLDFESVVRESLATRDSGRFIAFGSQGSGKTTLVKHFIQCAIDEVCNAGGDVYVIDPHAPKVVWPFHPSVKIIGAGLDYDSVKAFLFWLIQEKKKRYEAGCGDDNQPLPEPYKPIIVICEEWNGIVDKLVKDDIWDDVNQLLYRDARKASIGFMLITHEHTVGALGLIGKGNLLSGVEYFITLEKDRINRTYNATLGSSFKDKNPYQLSTPGAYHGRMYYSAEQIISERAKTDKYLVIDSRSVTSEPSILDLNVADEPEADEPKEPEPAKAKYHPDVVNAAIDDLLSDDPETFPTKGDVSEAVGITGGSKYKLVINVYNERFAKWESSN